LAANRNVFSWLGEVLAFYAGMGKSAGKLFACRGPSGFR
jgi:hypothetical protein